MCMDNRHNGWANWETWLFNLWYGDYYFEYAKDNNITDVQQLADDMKDYLIDLQEETDTEVGIFNDAISNCIREINYYEVAEKIIDEVNV